MKFYNKTVMVNGEKTKIKFANEHLERTFDSPDEKHNKHAFHINDKIYIVISISKMGKKAFSKWSLRYIYDGKTFPDSEKKVIEYILMVK